MKDHRSGDCPLSGWLSAAFQRDLLASLLHAKNVHVTVVTLETIPVPMVGLLAVPAGKIKR
jgi:hypothetical protein